jgi:hypothetical protein
MNDNPLIRSSLAGFAGGFMAVTALVLIRTWLGHGIEDGGFLSIPFAAVAAFLWRLSHI